MKNSQLLRKGLAVLLSSAFVLTSIPGTALVAKAQDLKELCSVTPADVIADFTFDAQSTEYTGGGAKATVVGEGATVADGVLVLDGSASYLNVTKEDSSSLLTDLSSLTVSFDVNFDYDNTSSWVFYAAPNADAPSWPNEHYLGIFQDKDEQGKLTVQEWNNSGGRVNENVAHSNIASSEWVHVNVVFTAEGATISLDGAEAAKTQGGIDIAQMLGQSSIVQIGKANWDQGEYCRASLDNVRIYNRALTTEEIAAEAAGADFEDLNALIAAEIKEQGSYDQAKWSAYQDALTDAKAVAGNKYASQTEVDKAKDALKTAEDSMKGLADKTALRAAITSAQATYTDESKYMTRVWEKYQERLAEAIAVRDNDDAQEGQVTEALTNLNNATSDLREFFPENIDQMKLEESGDPDYSYCSSWEAIAAVNDGVTGEQTQVKHYGTWGNPDRAVTEEWVSYTWVKPVYIDTTQIWFFDDGGGVQVPKSYTYEYWDAETEEWKAVTGASGMGQEKDAYNTTTFDRVFTTKFRVRMEEADAEICDGVGIIEWKVSGSYPEMDAAPLYEFKFEDNLDPEGGATDTVYAKAKTQTAQADYAEELVYEEGLTGNALKTEGKHGVEITVPTAGTEYTVALWAKPQATITTNSPLFAVLGSSAGGSEDWIALSGNDNDASHLKLWGIEQIDQTIPSHAKIGVVPYSQNEWQQFVLSVKDGNVVLYRNGEAVANGTGSATAFTREGAHVYLGINAWADPYYNGLYDDVQIYNKALTQEEVTVLYGSSKPVTDEEFQQAVEYSETKYPEAAEENYAQTSWQAYKSALDAAKALLEEGTAAAKRDALTKLNKAGAGLVSISGLKTAVAASKEAYPDTKEEEYSKTSWKTYKDALTAAEGVLADANATKEKVSEAIAALEKAENNLSERTDALADFNFDIEGEGNTFVSDNAKATGTYTLVDHGSGKALRLDSANKQYLTLTDPDGNSLLTGKTAVTVSCQVKPENSQNNWMFFAAPSDDAQTYRSEKYIGLFDIGGTAKAERYYSNSQDRPAQAESVVGYDGWYHVTVVYDETETILYINGEERARQTESPALETILGQNSVAYIGYSTWIPVGSSEKGEWYQGLIDNYRVYGRALTPEEVKAEAARNVDPTRLENAIAEAEKVGEESAYLPAGWKTFKDALDAANEALAAADTLTQDELDAAAAALETATKALEKKPDKSNLEMMIRAARAVKDEAQYTPKSWAAFQDAIDAAQKVFDNENATAADVEKAETDLSIAQHNNLTKRADKTALQAAIAAANQVANDAAEKDKYTTESWTEFTDAIAAAQKVYDDANATKDDVTKAIEDLAAAQTGLTEKGSEPEPEVDVNEWFTDVNPSGDNNWPVPEIQDVFDRGIMKGLDYEHHIFGTETNLSRAHLALMLWRHAGNGEVGPEPDGKTIDFKDVDANEEYAKAVAWASSENVGIVNGYKDEKGNLTGYFDPAAGITREQLSLMMVRYAKYLECAAAQEDAPEDTLSKFTDLDKINPYDGGEAKKALAWVVKNEIVQGEGGTTLLNPQGKVNRAVAATFFSRLLKNVVEAQ